MITKPKPRKALAAKAGVPELPDGFAKLQEAHGEMWDAINFLKLIELAADATAHGETDNAEDYAHAICTASRSSVDSIKRAYELVDEVSMKMLGREMDARKGIGA